MPRSFGHRKGVETTRRCVEFFASASVGHLTLFAFSSENWKRPQLELDFLMHLLEQYMIEERALIMEQNIRVSVIGRRQGIPSRVLAEIDKTIEMSSTNTGTRLCLAINYGGRGEMVDAIQRIARDAASGAVTPDQLTEERVSEYLYTHGMADPDLLIRTAGEMRVVGQKQQRDDHVPPRCP